MQYLVTARADEHAAMSPAYLAACKSTFERLLSEDDRRIVAAYPHADERAVTIVVEVDVVAEVADVLAGLPSLAFAKATCRPLMTAEEVLDLLDRQEAALGTAVASG